MRLTFRHCICVLQTEGMEIENQGGNLWWDMEYHTHMVMTFFKKLSTKKCQSGLEKSGCHSIRLFCQTCLLCVPCYGDFQVKVLDGEVIVVAC